MSNQIKKWVEDTQEGVEGCLNEQWGSATWSQEKLLQALTLIEAQDAVIKMGDRVVSYTLIKLEEKICG